MGTHGFVQQSITHRFQCFLFSAEAVQHCSKSDPQGPRPRKVTLPLRYFCGSRKALR